MTDEQRAREIAANFDDRSGALFRKLVPAILTAMQEAEARGVARERERCAGIAKSMWITRERQVIGDAEVESELCEEIAHAIRNTPAPEPEDVTARPAGGLSLDGGE